MSDYDEEYPATADTMMGPQFYAHAWSQEPSPAPSPSHPWGKVAALVAAFALLIGVVVFALIESVKVSHDNASGDHWPSGYTAPPAYTPPPVPQEPPPAPSPTHTPLRTPGDVPHASVDQAFLAALQRDGIGWRGDPSVAINAAHRGCAYMRANGKTTTQYATELVGSANMNGTWTYADALVTVRDMATYYCPEMDG